VVAVGPAPDRGRPLRFDGTTWTPVTDVPPTHGWWSFARAPDGTLLLASEEGAFVQRADGTVEDVDDRPGDYSARALLALPDGVIFAEEDDGLYVSRGGDATRFWGPADAPILDSPLRWSELVASPGAVWIAEEDGVWRCDVPAAASEGGCRFLSEGLPAPAGEPTRLQAYFPELSLARSADGTLWATGPAGTARLEGDAWTVVDEQPGSFVAAGPDGTIRVLWLDARDDALIGVLTALRATEAGWVVAERDPTPEGLELTPTIMTGADGSVWLAGGAFWQELARFDAGTWERVRSIAGRPIDGAAFGDGNDEGRLWVAGYDADDGDAGTGTWSARFDGTAWAVLELPADAELVPWAARVAPDGSVWLGGADGLWRLAGDTLARVAFAGSWVEPLAVSEDGTVWVAVDGGVYRVPPEAR
jgi:ligand-binding sensor domain-containing protein